MIAGSNIVHPGYVGTPTGSLDLVKLIINSVLSQRNAKFVCFDIKNFYLGTPLNQFEYVHGRFNEILQEFINKYNIASDNSYGWTYFEILKGCYGLLQSGKLDNDLLRKYIAKHGYYECATTPVLWRHQWSPITFVLLVDDFGVEYVG